MRRLLASVRSTRRLRRRLESVLLVSLFLLSVQQIPPLEVPGRNLTTRSGTITRCFGCCDGECRCTGSCCADKHVEVEIEPDPVLSRTAAWSRNKNCDGGYAPPTVSSVSKDLLPAARGETVCAPDGRRSWRRVRADVQTSNTATNVSPRGPPRSPQRYTQI